VATPGPRVRQPARIPHLRNRAGAAKVGVGTELAAIVIFRSKVQVVLNQTLGMGIQLLLYS